MICFVAAVTDDDVGLHVLGCGVDILGTNCNAAVTVFLLSFFFLLPIFFWGGGCWIYSFLFCC